MKTQYSTLLKTLLCTAAGILLTRSQADTYKVMLRQGLTFYANNLDATQQIDSTWAPGASDGMNVFRVEQRGFHPYSYFGGWDELPPLGRGEGAIIDSSSPILLQVTGANSSGTTVTPLQLLGNHTYLRGRQSVGLGTFENAIGRPPGEYEYVTLSRYNPTGGSVPFGSPPGGLDVYTYMTEFDHWYPKAPILDEGESALLTVGNLVKTIGPLSAFAINGVTPAYGQAGTTLHLKITGTGLNDGSSTTTLPTIIELVRGKEVVTCTPIAAESELPYVLAVECPLGLIQPAGFYNVRASRVAGKYKHLSGAVFINTSKAQLEMEIFGPSIVQPNQPNTYFLHVRNTSTTPLIPTNLQIDVSVNDSIGVGISSAPAISSQTTTFYSTSHFTVGYIPTLQSAGNSGDTTIYQFDVTVPASMLATPFHVKSKIVDPMDVEMAEFHFPIKAL